MTNFKENIQRLLSTIKDGAGDVSNLEVTTLSGDITPFLDREQKLDIGSVKEDLNKTVQSNNHLEVVAHTKMAFDQDTVLFVKEDMTDNQQAAFNLHHEMLKTARASRLAFIHFVQEILDKEE